MKSISVPRETNEQQMLIRWAHYHPICSKYLIAIPNGGSRNLLEGAKLKREGVKRGVSDLFLAYPSNGFHGLWIEMKRKSTYAISPEQRAWMELMRSVGYAGHIAFGWEDAVRIIKEYLGEEQHTIFG
jgi:hypothetical protein